MLSSKTVFVVGAGASKEVGLPVGDELKITIGNKLDLQFDTFGRLRRGCDHIIHHVLQQTYPEHTNTYVEACLQIRDGIVLSRSIDDFIDAHQHDPCIAICGKLAIARSILEAERDSKFYYDTTNIYNTIDFNTINNTWYVRFYQLLRDQVAKDNLANIFNNVTVITFNYDRCIEHFLVHAIAANYQITKDIARELVAKLSIFHPYGSVGAYFGLPHEQVPFGHSGVPALSKIIESIRTYTEQIEDDKSLTAMREAVTAAEVIVFLGTAYHRNNMKFLVSEKGNLTKKTIYATRKGVSDADLQVVTQALSKLSRTAQISHFSCHFAMDCQTLFEDYWMSLTK